MITVYSKPGCDQCSATKRALNRRSLTYEVVDLTQNQEAYDFVSRLGHQAAPVVVVSEEGQLLKHWSGYDPAQIAGIGEAHS